MRKLGRAYWVGAMLTISGVLALAASVRVLAQQANKPAFVIVERLSTTGPESIQEQYGKVSREIVAKFGGRYLARSQHNKCSKATAARLAASPFCRSRVWRQRRAGSIHRKIRMPQRSGAAAQLSGSFGWKGCLDPDLASRTGGGLKLL